jgi:hypothetical protein
MTKETSNKRNTETHKLNQNAGLKMLELIVLISTNVPKMIAQGIRYAAILTGVS